MGADILSTLRSLLGIGAEDLSLLQMSLRAVVIFLAAIAMVRIGDKRFLGKSTAFDVILGVILGSVLSRAINGSASLVPTLGASLVLVSLHYLFAFIAFRSDRFGNLVKGRARRLVKDGEIQWEEMSKSHISKDDLLSSLRYEGNVSGLEKVVQACLERSGNISVIKSDEKAEVLEVSVSEGTQTVRIIIQR